jgi:leader peptidase (prepilin peptidase) / N-methyltransferase
MFPQIAAGTVFLYCAVVIAADDYTFRIVPDRILAILFTTGALYGLLAKDRFGEDLQDTISGLAFRSAIPGLSALLLALLYKFARGRDGLGLGDIKLIVAAGIWLPVLGSFYAIALASIVAVASALALALWRKRAATLLDSLPFAVFLAPAFWLLWLLEETGVLPALG